jgi:hypothetical protein
MNLGMKNEGNRVYEKIEAKRYLLTEEERKLQFEKIKQLKDDVSFNLDKPIFGSEKALDVSVIDQIRIHESWSLLSEELLRWGEF